MLDLKFIRQHVEAVKANIVQRKAQADVDLIIKLDDQRLVLLGEIESKRAELKAGSKSKPSPNEIVRLRQLGEQIATNEEQLREAEKQLNEQTSLVPNMSSPDMPVGNGELDNVEVRVWIPGHGEVETSQLGTNDEIKYRALLERQGFQKQAQEEHQPQTANRKPQTFKHHLEVGESLGIIDMAQAAKVAGTRFAYLLDGAALLENAIVQLLSTKLINHGFMWVDPPLLVREPVLFGTSHFPEGRDQVYQIASEHVEDSRELFLVGSSEPPLFAYGMDRVFRADELPLKMFAVTPCFRSEVGSWGKDVRGIKRVHQFNKLEMDVIAPPSQAEAIFDELIGYNQWLLEQLALPYRIINKCTGDCGYLASYKQYDVEVWMPSQQEFMETMTDTWATDFQARRMNIKYEALSVRGQASREFVHTVNDTGAALGRLVAAILDNFQQPDGSVSVPEALRPWVGKDVLEPNKLARFTAGK